MNQGGSNRSMHADNTEGQGHQHQESNEGQNVPDPAPAPAPAPMVNPFANITPETWEALQAFAGLLRANEKRDTDVKINDPEIFDGSTSKARAFLQDCELAFVINPHKFKEDRYKIGYILSFMKHGMAREFATYWHGYVEDKGWPLYSEFKEAFIKHFYATDRSAQAFAELRNHRMTGTADKYITRFQTLVHEAGIKDPVALQGYFLQGLSAEMLKNLAKESRAIPNYPEVVEIVRTLDHNKRLISNVSSLGGIATSMNRPQVPRSFGNNQGQTFGTATHHQTTRRFENLGRTVQNYIPVNQWTSTRSRSPRQTVPRVIALTATSQDILHETAELLDRIPRMDRFPEPGVSSRRIGVSKLTKEITVEIDPSRAETHIETLVPENQLNH